MLRSLQTLLGKACTNLEQSSLTILAIFDFFFSFFFSQLIQLVCYEYALQHDLLIFVKVEQKQNCYAKKIYLHSHCEIKFQNGAHQIQYDNPMHLKHFHEELQTRINK